MTIFRNAINFISQYFKSAFCISVVVYISAFCHFNIANAQAKFTASAPKTIPENQNFNLSFKLQNSKGSNLRLPALNDFTVVGGPSTSSQTMISNGDVSQTQTYTYVLRPKKQGTFKIGKASIDADGSTFQSNEVSITVTAPSSQKQQSQNDPFNDPFFNDPFGSGQQEESQTSIEDLKKQIKDDVFVKVVLNKNSVYQGEVLTATYKLYFRQNLSGFNLSKSPSMDGFWSKEIELDPKRKQTTENFNGKQYYVIDILKYNLYPQRSGNLTISPAEVSTNAQVVTQRGGGFFGFGQQHNVPLNLKTNSITINVKSLPEKEKPKNFAGAVGKFNFATSLSDKEAKTDDAVTYTIKISGEGNLNLIEAPTVEPPQGFELYDPKLKENISNTESGISGSKQYDFLLVPRLPGDFKFTSQSFSYFDPSLEKYFTITSPEFPLKVTGEPSKTSNGNNTQTNNQQDVSILGEDIRYIKTSIPNFEKNANSFFGSAAFYILYSIPFFAFVGLIAFRKRNEKLAADIVGSKRRKAMKLARKRLNVAEKYFALSDKKNFYDEISRAMWGYIGNKLNIDMAELSKDNAEEKLLSKHVTVETISKLQQLINTCELSLYSPSSNDSEMKNNYTTALNLIADLEDEIRN